MRCLLLYYSFTGQTDLAVAQAASACLTHGWEAVTCRIDIADPAERLVRPLSIASAKKWTQGAQKGMIVPLVYEPAEAVDDDYGLVLLFTSTWGGAPNVPVRSFLEGPQAGRLLRGKNFGVLVICRRVWKKNLALVRHLGEAAGGRFVGGETFMHGGSQVGSLLQTVTYLFRNDTGRQSFARLPLPAYGLSPASLAKVAPTVAAWLQKSSG